MAKTYTNITKVNEMLIATSPLQNNAMLAVGGNVMSSMNVTVQNSAGVVQAPLTKTKVSGEQLNPGEAVFLATSAIDINMLTITDNATSQTNFGLATGNKKTGQTFITTAAATINKIKVFLIKNGSPTDNVVCSIRELQYQAAGAGDEGYFPTTVDLGSGTVNGSTLTGSFVEYSFTLNKDVNLLKGVSYAVVLSRSGLASDADYYSLSYDSGGSTYSGGFAIFENSSSAWQARANDSAATIILSTVANRVYKSSAVTTAQSNNFLGFVQFPVTFLKDATIQISGISDKFSGLTNGQNYLSDTRGTISTTPGTVTRKVGIAISSTQLLINNNW